MQPRRAFGRARRRLGRWLRGLSGTRPEKRAELWHGACRKTYLVPYETSWRRPAP